MSRSDRRQPDRKKRRVLHDIMQRPPLTTSAEHLDHSPIECGDVARTAARHRIAVDDDLLIHPVRSSVLEIDSERRTRGQERLFFDGLTNLARDTHALGWVVQCPRQPYGLTPSPHEHRNTRCRTPSIHSAACASICGITRSRSSLLRILRCIGEQTFSFVATHAGSSPEASRTLLKRSDGAEKIDSAKLWPVHIGEIKLAVSALPEQEAGQTDLATCADDEVEVG
jgi:hypothetical protein